MASPPHPAETSIADEVVRAFGGLSATARALGHRHVTTVHGWQRAQRIPPWRRHEIAEAAERAGIALPDGFASPGSAKEPA